MKLPGAQWQNTAVWKEYCRHICGTPSKMPEPDSFHSPTVPLWRGKIPGLPEFFALLNALPNAALIVDRKKLVIQICNAAFQRLTGFSQGELIAASLQT